MSPWSATAMDKCRRIRKRKRIVPTVIFDSLLAHLTFLASNILAMSNADDGWLLLARLSLDV